MYLCLLDLTKAFDRVNRRSDDFEIQNGVRQGSVASPSYFNLYIDEIFQLMKDSGLGCRIHNQYYGLIGYADDLALLAPAERLFKEWCVSVNSFSQVEESTSAQIVTLRNPKQCVCLLE